MTTPLPQVVLYGRSRCHLCADAREALELILEDRSAGGLPVPLLVERDIDEDPALHDRWFELVPVVEIGDRRLELATSHAKLRRFVADALDGATAQA